MDNIVFLNSSLNINNITGIEAASCFRSIVFEKYMKSNIYFYTVNYSNRAYEHFSLLKAEGKISKSAKLLNIYTYYQQKNEDITTKVSSINDLDFFSRDWEIVQKPGTNDLRIFNKEEKKTLYVHRDSSGYVSFINTMVTSSRVQNVQREWYDEKGYLSKTQIFDLSNDKVLTEIYYRVDGSICIVKHFQNKNNKQALIHINLYDKNGCIIHFFNSESDFIAHWLNEITNNNNNYFFIMERSANYYQSLKKVESENVYKIGIVHASHLVYGEKHLRQSALEVPLNSAYRSMLEELEDNKYLDQVIVFSARQLDDIKTRFGISSKLVCIPNMLHKMIEKVDFPNRDLTKIITLARYAPVKQHKSAVRMMKYVVDRKPNAVLEMYGNGPEKENIKKYIKELNLENNIKVNNYVDNTSNVYNQSAIFILTSLSEGFPLTILEALSHGVPCVAYNIRYGPDAMIQSGINGYLVSPNNEKEMAERVLELLENEKKLKEFSSKAYEANERFGIESIVKVWLEMIKNIK